MMNARLGGVKELRRSDETALPAKWGELPPLPIKQRLCPA